jgi:hypothetical protein
VAGMESRRKWSFEGRASGSALACTRMCVCARTGRTPCDGKPAATRQSDTDPATRRRSAHPFHVWLITASKMAAAARLDNLQLPRYVCSCYQPNQVSVAQSGSVRGRRQAPLL